MSNLSDLLNEHGLEAEALAAQSAAIEVLSNEDRARHGKRAAARRAKKSYEDAEAPKPERFRRGVSVRILKQAVDGVPVPRMSRKKILRAMNSLLAAQKKDAVELSAAFGDVAARPGKKK